MAEDAKRLETGRSKAPPSLKGRKFIADYRRRDNQDEGFIEMKSEIKVTGNFRQRLHDLAQKSRELDGQHEIPLSELMPDDFVGASSSFPSLKELFAASPFEIHTLDDFKAIPDEDWDKFISTNTTFATWGEMQQAAVREWTQHNLGFK